jgi:hypothetical protein
MVCPRLPSKSALKTNLRPSFNTILKAPGCSVTRTSFPIADSHWKVCGEPVDSEVTSISQMSGREQSGSLAIQSTVFITLKRPPNWLIRILYLGLQILVRIFGPSDTSKNGIRFYEVLIL